MSIDAFLNEIEDRKKNDITNIDKEFDDKKSETEIKKTRLLRRFKNVIPTKLK